jgi:6,7-dimethyl-8-ribityllumazine synthase
MAQNDDIQRFAPDLSGAGLRIGIVVARFNQEVGEKLLASCTATLKKNGVRTQDVRVVSVPGALETPLALQKLANTGKFDALIALGAVIRGETYHFEIVSNESASGITSVALDTGVPIANGILTTNDEDQALARVAEKGADCALAAIEMANLLRKLGAPEK